MIEKTEFIDDLNRSTSFEKSEGAIWLSHICGLVCSLNETETGPDGIHSLFVLETDEEPVATQEIQLVACQTERNKIEIEWAIGTSGLHWQSIWSLQPTTGIWSRRDILTNRGDKAFHARRALARFPFAPGDVDIYTQASSWAHENQGRWNVFSASDLTLRCQAGRTNQGASPYLFLCLPDTALGISFHILPRGNWVIRVDRSHSVWASSDSITVVELGLTDEMLQLEIPVGATIELPEIIIQAISSREPEMGAPDLHRYALNRFFPRVSPALPLGMKNSAPLIYNTWFDVFEDLNVERLREQLTAAKEIGCEVFVVDAGWYGNGTGPWDRQVGDWREKEEAAFCGRMVEFSHEVRLAGLGFGLWMEPERFAAGVPILKAHPDWFLPCPGGYFYPNLSLRPVYEYVLAEVSRLIETYQLAWMKVDFNLEMGDAVDGLAGYYQAWYGMLDELRQRFPETFFEGCASGGMRLDLNTLAHFDWHFLSDTVNPVDMLRITQGALLRVPPGRLTKWAVLRPIGGSIPRYGLSLAKAPDRVIAPGGANWEEAMVTDLDFICRAALPGMLGLSGDLAGLPDSVRLRLRHQAEFYKRWREFLADSICHLLTPIGRQNEREGWIAFQLQSPDGKGANLVFVYRLDDGLSRKRIPLRELDPKHLYTITNDDAPCTSPWLLSGSELTASGLPVELPTKFNAGVYILQP